MHRCQRKSLLVAVLQYQDSMQMSRFIEQMSPDLLLNVPYIEMLCTHFLKCTENTFGII